MYTLIIIKNGKFNSSKMSANLQDLILHAKGTFVNGFNANTTECLIVNKYGDTVFNYE